MALTVNAKTYTGNVYGTTAITYYGPLKTVSVSDDIRLGFVAPKPTTVFSGVGRSSAKLTRSLTLTGALTTSGQAIVDINISFPVGAASADEDAMLNDMGAYLASASFKTLAKNFQIAY